MINYFNKLEKMVSKYREKYARRPKTAALRLAYWNLKACFSSQITKEESAGLNKPVADAWMQVINGDGIDITGNYLHEIQDFKIPKIPSGGHINFNIDNALKVNKKIKRLGLVFFMGVGDYFLSTNFIENFKNCYPNLVFDAYVSKNTDKNSSVLVGECLKVNPNFENVYYFDGYPADGKSGWKNYDYSECYRKIKEDTLLLPVIYMQDEHIKSRHETLCRTFSLSKPVFTPAPKVYTDYEATKQVSDIISKVDQKMAGRKGIVWLQLASRSAKYLYPLDKARKLVNGLVNEGYLVINIDHDMPETEHVITIDIKKVSINESIKLLCMLNKKYRVYCAGIVSCFFAISSGLKIQNLGIQHTYDRFVEAVWFPNIFIIGDREYRMLPKSRVFEASLGDYTINSNNRCDYRPEFILSCFNQFQAETTL
ncbi:MAG: hypothetical protein FWG57_02215 [Endomicrobia bacterium]|nr:hypothetical protein [Endomicrobiia bacterium]